LKRSNRLVLLVGVFLAIVAFVGILLLSRGGGTGTSTPPPPTTGPVVIATAEIPLSTYIRADQLKVETKDLTAIVAGAYTDISQVVGKIARQKVAVGAQVTSAVTSGGTQGQISSLTCPPTLRCIAVHVNQNTGVGTVIRTGDYVDMVVGFTGENFPVVTVNPDDESIQVVTGLNSTSVKLILQGMQVMGTLLPPPPAPTTGSTATPPPSTGSGPTSLNGQDQIVILAVTAQQSEVIKFAQIAGIDGTVDKASVTLILRSPDDFIDPVTGEPIPVTDTATTGVILKTLIDDYGVLPPQIIQGVIPTAP
jgi:Flp pilus assembly protein CpaB